MAVRHFAVEMIKGNKKSATAIERAAKNGSKTNILKGKEHAKGHVLNKKEVAEGAKPLRGRPHVQTNDVEGHTFYTASAVVINGGLNLVADGLDGIATGLEWAEENLPSTMSLIEKTSSIIDPTRGIEPLLPSSDNLNYN